MIAALSLVMVACGARPSTGTLATQRVGESQPARPFTVSSVAMWADDWSYNPWAAAGYASWPLDWFVVLPLGVNNPPNPNDYLPVLATHWTVKSSTVTIDLRRDARWQNGDPVTSRDVLTTLLIDGTEGAGGLIWPYVTSVTTPNAHTLVVKVKPGYSSDNVLQELLDVFPAPSSQYGHFVNGNVKQLEADIALENQTSNGAPTPAATKEAADLAKLFARVSQYAPKTVIGDGPFRMVAQTIEEAKLSKWKGFYDSAKVHVPAIDALNFPQADQIVGQQAEGDIDYTWENYSSLLLAHRFLSVKGNKIQHEVALSTESYFFDPYRYPFTLKAVRQAIAYAIELPQVDYQGRGKEPGLSIHSFWRAKADIDGLNLANEQAFLTPATEHRLTSYRYDPSKAAKLLTSAGFHKVGGHWMMPDGKPFAITVYLWAGRPTPSGLYITDALKRFGIASSTVALPNAQILPEVETGSQNAIAFEFGATDSNPLASLLSMASEVAPPKGQNPVANVPGIGKVNVVQALSHEELATNVGPQMKKLVNLWARYFNQQVDFLTYSNYMFPYQYNTSHYTDWPAPTSKLWNVKGHLRLIFEFMIHGYLRPAR